MTEPATILARLREFAPVRTYLGYGRTIEEAYEIALDEAARPADYDPIVECSCGRTHDAASWAALPLVGYQADEGLPDSLLELRDCPCGSTRSREVPRCPLTDHELEPGRNEEAAQ